MAKKIERQQTEPKLVALRPILFRGRQYRTGDRLPADDQKMVEAWIQYKSAKWEGQETKKKEPVAPVQQVDETAE